MTSNPSSPLNEKLAESVSWERLQHRGKKGKELIYLPNEESPFTGWAKRPNESDEGLYLQELEHIRDGKLDGPFTKWHENGQKCWEGTHKEGKIDGLYFQWFNQGQKQMEGNYKDGEIEGLFLSWHENGQKKFEGNYEDGKREALNLTCHENGQKPVEGNN